MDWRDVRFGVASQHHAGFIFKASALNRIKLRNHHNHVGKSVLKGTENVLMKETCQELPLMGVFGLATKDLVESYL